MNKRIIEPEYQSQIDPDEFYSRGEKKYAEAKKNVAKNNLHIYYTTLYQALEKGIILKEKIETLVNGQSKHYGFHPDVILITKNGWRYTEIKSSSWDHYRFDFPVDQVKNYCIGFWNRIKSGDYLPSVEIGLYRYGKKRDSGLYCGSSKHCSQSDHRTFTNNLSNSDTSTRDLIIIPINFFLGILSDIAAHKIQKRDHTSSNTSRNYENSYVINGSLLSKLHQFSDTDQLNKGYLEQLVKNITKIGGDPNLLVLDGLKLESKVLPNNIYAINHGTEYHLKQFPITKITMDPSAQKSFMRKFKKRENRKNILLGMLRMETLIPQRVEDF